MRAPALNFRPATDDLPPLAPGARWVPLDLLRAGAILLVLHGHVDFRMPDTTAAFNLMYILRQMGLIGVDMFLVLSGFFTGLFFFSRHRASGGKIACREFFFRRAWKIWPSYFLAVLMVVGWQMLRIHKGGIIHRAGAALGDTWQYFAHVQNFSEPRADYIQQTWTIVLIVHFYLAFPLLLLILRKLGDGKDGKPFRSIPWLFAATALLCLLLRYQAAASVDQYGRFEWNAWTQYFPTQIRIDELMAGVLLAYFAIYFSERMFRTRPAALQAMVVALSIACMLPVALRIEESPHFLFVWGYSLAALGCVGMTWLAWCASQSPAANPVANHSSWTHWLPVRALASLGVCSYSIYIWHQPFAQWLNVKIGNKVCDALHLWGSPIQYLVLTLIYMSIAITSGVIMYFLIERPALAFRDRLLRNGPGSIRSSGPAQSPESGSVHKTLSTAS